MRHVARAQCIFAASLSMFASGASWGAGNLQGNPGQRTFESSDEAGAALFEAAKSRDEKTLTAIFGPDAQHVLFSGDVVKDKDTLKDFVAAYTQMHRWTAIKAGGQMLYVGADNFIFPIPLDRNAAGRWQFDTDAGKDEIVARRIGRDELTAIAACVAVTRAQYEYFSESQLGVKQYAQRFVSDQGKKNGLYWPVLAGQSPSPLEDVAEFAKAVGYTSAGTKPQPFEGYYFRILSKQGEKAKGGARNYIVDGKMTGGFAVIAYPADYRSSGIMTFIVGPDGVVYQKDLGKTSRETAAALSDYNPGDGWSPAIPADPPES
jgi:Protein of unknown function (DUF2950)